MFPIFGHQSPGCRTGSESGSALGSGSGSAIRKKSWICIRNTLNRYRYPPSPKDVGWADWPVGGARTGDEWPESPRHGEGRAGHHHGSVGASTTRASCTTTKRIKPSVFAKITKERNRIRIRIRIHRIHMFLGLPDPDPLVRDIDPDPTPDPSTSCKINKKNLDSYYFVTLFDFLSWRSMTKTAGSGSTPKCHGSATLLKRQFHCLPTTRTHMIQTNTVPVPIL